MPPWFQTLLTPVNLAMRSQVIAFVLTRHGVAGSLASLGLEVGRRGLSFVQPGRPDPVRFDRVFGRNLAKTFAKLGPTFIKLGQVLASRPDIAGEPVSDELRVLFDKVPALPFRAIRRILRSEWGSKKWALIGSIDPTPLAAASIAQVHSAVLKDGTAVIIKVQRPGVASTVRLDLQLLEGFVRGADLIHSSLQLGAMFADFKQATLSEIDYRQEAKNIDRFRRNYRKLFSQGGAIFPRYYPQLTTERVIVLEPMRGKSVAQLRKGSTVARVAAEQSLAAILEQIFDHGFFHADPHAGNLFFEQETGQVGFIDLGLVGHLHPQDKKKFLKVIMAVLKRDKTRLAKALYELGEPGPKADFKAFDQGVQALLEKVQTQGVNNVPLDRLLNQLLTLARKNRLHIPNRYVMMIRSCLVIEGVAKSLNPKLSVFQVATPIVTKSLLKTYNPLSVFWRK